ncbi:MAG: hypothetical protein ACC707_21325 [Thiohalomonadales bacterium]
MTEEKIKCKACKELIWADATICPQCQTHQTKQFAKTILNSLKELSAITVIFTLIFAVMELNRFADAWFEKSEYVSRLAKSASILMDAGEYAGARKLLADAKKISPVSEEVATLQMQIAVNNIRNSGYATSADEAQAIIHSLNVLYHNLGSTSENDVIAFTHIARASRLLYRRGYKEVDYNLYLDMALALDDSYVYANIYKGLWYLTKYDESALKEALTDAELTQKAQYHFNVALQQNIDSDYIRHLQIPALQRHKSQASAAEYLKLIFTMHANNNTFFLDHQKEILGFLLGELNSAISDLEKNKTTVQNNVYLTLSEKNINIIKKAFKPTQENKRENAIAITLLAITSHHKGDDQGAIEGYMKAYKILENTSNSLRYITLGLVKKVCDNAENLSTESMDLCGKLTVSSFGRVHFIDN